MPEPGPTLTLSLDPTSEPIAGSIRKPDGTAIAFSGYMELAAALERLREQAAAQSRTGA